MTYPSADRFWIAADAWRYALKEGLRGAGAIGVAIFFVWNLGWLLHTDEPLVSWLRTSLFLSLAISVPLLPIFTLWARWDLWRNNRVTTK